MQRVACQPRQNWQTRVEEQGLVFHTSDNGEPYWDESAHYIFTADEISLFERAAYAIDKLCLQAVDHVMRTNRFEEFQIPPAFTQWLRQSWEQDNHTIYGRFDFLYDGASPPKLIEFNADTPTALLEAAVVQWFWLKDVAPDADQFNSLHERLIEAWRGLHQARPAAVTFTSVAGHVEDYVTANYLRDVAVQAGITTQYLTMQQLGWNPRMKKFVDLQDRGLACVFKLYPWEWMFGEQFAEHIVEAPTRWLEPPWKAILSCKALLPLLWEMFPGHVNLLPASWKPLEGWQVRKPARGREGANVSILNGTKVVAETPGQYADERFIYQQFHPTPRLDGQAAVLGCWMVNGYACGLGIREDQRPITTNTSRFVPHLVR